MGLSTKIRFLLEVARCPVSGQRLKQADEALVARIDIARQEGALRLSAAVPQLDLAAPIEALLLTEDGTACYPVQGGIPILLADHRLPLV